MLGELLMPLHAGRPCWVSPTAAPFVGAPTHGVYRRNETREKGRREIKIFMHHWHVGLTYKGCPIHFAEIWLLLLMMMLISCERKHYFFRWKVLLKNRADIFFNLMEHISPIYSVTLLSQSPILDFRRNGKKGSSEDTLTSSLEKGSDCKWGKSDKKY
jgi:hypothetical protein